MPTIASHKQPTIAIITAQYSEKLAVDAMLENKETFVRYTTVGKFYHGYSMISIIILYNSIMLQSKTEQDISKRQ